MKLERKIMILVPIFILFYAFWWYELRPSSIREDCAQEASDIWNKKKNSSGFNDELSAQRYFNMYYEVCVHKKGL